VESKFRVLVLACSTERKDGLYLAGACAANAVSSGAELAVKDEKKTKKQLIAELRKLRRQLDSGGAPKLRRVQRRDPELRHSRKTVQALLEGSIDLAIILDVKGTIVALNRKTAKTLGVSRRESIGSNVYDFFPPEVAARRLAQVNKVVRTGKPAHFRDMRGGLVFEQKVYPILDEQRKVTEVAIFVHDITDAVRRSEKLIRSEAIARALLDASLDLAVVVNADGTVADLHWEAAKALGGTRRKIIGKTAGDLFAPEIAEKRQAQCDKVIRTGRAVRHEDTRAGRWFDQSYYPVFDEKGSVDRVVVFARDITQRKRAELALRESEANFRALADNANESIFIASGDGKNLYANERACKMTGYTESELLKMTIRDVAKPSEAKRIEKYARNRVRGENAPRRYETVLVGKDGREILVRVSASMATWHGKRVTFGMIDDITEHRRMEREIVEVGSRERHRIGRDIHDSLGSQLTGVGFLAAALEGRMRDKWPAEAKQAARIGLLIGNAIARTKGIARGLVPVALEDESLGATLKSLCHRTRRVFGIECKCILDKGVVLSDNEVATHLYRIVEEALNNAVQHGRAKRIEVRLKMHDDRGRLTIRDNGKGLPAKLAPKSGMGLRIMRYRAGMIGGELDLGRNAAGGATVTCFFQKGQRRGSRDLDGSG